MRTPDQLMALVPGPLRPLMQRRKETVKFLIVGGTCYMITVVVNYLLRLTVLGGKPVTALVIATVVSTIVSYVLNREWSFRARGGRRVYHEAALFIMVNVVAVGINAAPLWAARYVFGLSTPHVSRPVVEVSDFVNGMILGTALAMVFRLWAFKRWVFPELPDEADQAGSPLAGAVDADAVVPETVALAVVPTNGAAVNGAPANGAPTNGAAVVGRLVAGVPLLPGAQAGSGGALRVNGSQPGRDTPGPRHRPTG